MSKILEYIKKYDILILIFLGFLFYFQAFSFNILFYDDLPYILNNEYLNGIKTISLYQFFDPKFVRDDIYMPMTFIVYWLIIKFFGANAFVFHFINIFIYISSSIALFYLFKKIINNYSVVFFAVILYILHPCHIENTAWISAMGYNISALFFFLSFIYFIIAFDENKKLNYIYSVIFYIFAILSQPIAVTLPAILFLWVYCFRGDRLKESIKYICAYIPFLLIFLFLFKKTVSNSRFVDLFDYNVLQKISFLGEYLFTSFIPINLCPIQPLPTFFSIIYFIIFVLSIYYFRKNIIILFFFLFWLFSILPYLNIFFPVAIPIADRYLLLSSISSCILISYFSFYIFDKFKEKKLIKYLSFFSFFIIYLVSFLIYLPIWKDDLALWNYSYKNNPSDINIKKMYSKYLILCEKYDEAIYLADEIIKDRPDLFEGYEIKILSLMKKNEIKKATDVCFIVKNIIPNDYMNYLYLCDIYVMQGDFENAYKSFAYAKTKAKEYNLYKNDKIDLFANKEIILSYVNVDIDSYIKNLQIISNNFRLLQDQREFLEILNKEDYKSREEICLNYLKKYNSEYSRYVVNLLSCLYIKEIYKNNASIMMKSFFKDMNKAQEFINKGDNNSAEKIYLSIISKDKYMYEAYYNLGFLYLNTNRPKESRKIFDEMLKINPNDKQIKQFIYSLGENIKNE